MNKEQMQEFVELCKRPEIQRHYEWIHKNYCIEHNCDVSVIDDFGQCDETGDVLCKKSWVFYPNSDQLIEILGDRFESLKQEPHTKEFVCIYWVKASKTDFAFGSHQLIALAKAVIEMEGGKDES